MPQEGLKSWIEEEMTLDDDYILNKYKGDLSSLIGLTREGNVIFHIDRTKYRSKYVICLFYIGKLFANIAGYVETAAVSNTEIINETGIPKGTVGRTVVEMRNQKIIRKVNNQGNEIILNSIPMIIDEIKAEFQVGDASA